MRLRWQNTSGRYGAAAKTFHWLIALLIFAQFGLGIDGAQLPLGIDKLIMLARHKSVGITIFLLAALRVSWRWFSPPPLLPGNMIKSERLLAHASHTLLYVLLFALPLTGWFFSSASGIAVSWFNIVALPNVVPTSKSLASVLLSVHIALAITLAIVVVGHIAAALWHHFVRRDTVLVRMLPWGSHSHGDSR